MSGQDVTYYYDFFAHVQLKTHMRSCRGGYMTQWTSLAELKPSTEDKAQQQHKQDEIHSVKDTGINLL